MTTQTVSDSINATKFPPKSLRQLIRSNGCLRVDPSDVPDVMISDVCCDSRQVTPGSLFVAIAGSVTDGAHYIDEAIRRGAAGIVVDRNVAVQQAIPVVRVADARIAVSQLAATFFGLNQIQSRGDLAVIGVTGTNGKSTIAYMIRSILQAAERPTAMWGTIEYDLISRKIRGGLTTPDPVSLVKQLVEAYRGGARYAIMEVSSHSLDQHRTDGIRFSVAIFTNLTQDHLDYHRCLDDYFRAKRRLFDALEPDSYAVVNADDPAGDRILEHCHACVMRFGISDRPQEVGGPPPDTIGLTIEPDVRAILCNEDNRGVRYIIEHDPERMEVQSPLVGRHNVSNALAAASACLSLGLNLDTIRRGLKNLAYVPGRLQRVDSGELDADVFVDYAHTDDALRNVLRALRSLTRGQLWCVFGCGGDRDRSKRPKMARAVAEGADGFVITSDNPRTEDPTAIIADIENGLEPSQRSRCMIEPDRAKAITLAVHRLLPGDTLLVAGKGHETHQIIGRKMVPFDDVEMVGRAIQQVLDA